MATLNNEQKSTQELFVDKNSEDQSELLQPHSLNQLTENVIVNIIRINNGEKITSLVILWQMLNKRY